MLQLTVHNLKQLGFHLSDSWDDLYQFWEAKACYSYEVLLTEQTVIANVQIVSDFLGFVCFNKGKRESNSTESSNPILEVLTFLYILMYIG